MIKHDKIYLAGPIKDKSSSAANGWREVIEDVYEDELSVHIVNPLKLELSDGRTKLDICGNDELVDHFGDEIVETDLACIRGCTGVLVNWDDSTQTAGTPMEMMHAKEYGVPVALVYKGNPRNISPFLKYFSDIVFRSIKNGMDFLVSDKHDNSEG